MAARKPDRLSEVIKELEAMAGGLRVDVRRAVRQAGLTKRLERAAAMLRLRAASVARQVERYAHEVRVELSKSPNRLAARRRRAA